ncbi:MAG TPA: hypothetical protein VEO95_02265 [Chthoniobacteraceae bacterium]|nr:hypothetical protein [Chthoniobacteraceae bacterium]
MPSLSAKPVDQAPLGVMVTIMNAQEILDSLPALTPSQWEQIEKRIGELRPANNQPPSGETSKQGKSWREAIRPLVGSVDGPDDWAENHDHYIHGTPKRSDSGVR